MSELEELRTALAIFTEQNKRLRGALKFYADPGREIPGAAWQHDYPGGITWSEGDQTFIDTGEIARRALRWRAK
jgi:hypothetical protein